MLNNQESRQEITDEVGYKGVCACSVMSGSLQPMNCIPPMVCSPPGSSVHRILQARRLEWVAISSSGGSSQPRDRTCVFCIGRWILYHRATWESQIQEYRVREKNKIKELVEMGSQEELIWIESDHWQAATMFDIKRTAQYTLCLWMSLSYSNELETVTLAEEASKKAPQFSTYIIV